MQYLSSVTATDRYSLSTKLLAIFQISSAQYFQYSSHQSPSGSHVFHGEIMYTYSTVTRTPSKYAVFVPLSPSSTKFCKIPWKHRNSAEMGKFHGLAQNSTFRGKLWSLVMVIMINIKYLVYTGSFVCCLCTCDQFISTHSCRLCNLYQFVNRFVYLKVYSCS